MDFLSTLNNKRRARGILIVIFLLIAIPLTIFLVRQQQIFKGRALGEGSTLEAFAASGAPLPDSNNNGIPETQSQNILLKLTWNPGAAQPTLTPSPTRTPTPTTSAPTATTAPGQPTPTTTTGGSCTVCTADLIRDGTVNQDDLTVINACKNITTDLNLTFDAYLASNPQYSTLVTLCRSMDLNSSNKTEQSEVDCVQSKMDQTCSQNNIPTPTPTTAATGFTCVINGPGTIPSNQASSFTVERTTLGNQIYPESPLTCISNSTGPGSCFWGVDTKRFDDSYSSTTFNITPSNDGISPGAKLLYFYRPKMNFGVDYGDYCQKEITVQ
ncbi:hypothetical protein A3F00_02740 [Candidatus Daviesbacteria bacterium RIFCSPHIGHO2_12_FULL_37_11]|uniref:Uncharacterized protein n=1 Tax=Candidatus Daviesbacteria bacterium RIFCSPHIGHO2_12_FULL_37_11 TaxID=1797777 RepID=A0A1F5KEI2_9BACT|nr:MAG: hypothetical protein A2111_00840 [Candidatus Daviesbacteria bacterium GWA1_38_6]OGE39353.1 MAG: hypothetical protein A3F00_02740 [Candidatus Daviesbacteria bacterium RIFCSPHIGHO2_12_FULL_37_11]OGE45149.1 MAG: hypothetical protein A3B39_01910 [Candidatus Daviesbacteria bacterium RIFCSPLOWO2_01_FULL_37_10]